MSRPLSESRLQAENRYFQGTCGVSAEASRKHLIPAFRDSETGRVEIARFKNGKPAPVHVIEGLPEEWAVAHDERGVATMLRSAIVCGFVCGNRFYTRAEAAGL